MMGAGTAALPGPPWAAPVGSVGRMGEAATPGQSLRRGLLYLKSKSLSLWFARF